MGVEELEVKLLAINERGQLQLSRKAVLQERKSKSSSSKSKSTSTSKSTPNSSMSNAEVDVIAKAIEGVSDD